jgi:hypothetical protein
LLKKIVSSLKEEEEKGDKNRKKRDYDGDDDEIF